MATELQRTIIDSLRAELERQGLTQEQLARRLEVSQPWVSRRLSGQTDFAAAELDRIAEALDVPVTAFLPERVA